MRIGELGQAMGVDIETIRYYEKAGLLAPPARTANGYRAYSPAHVERLAFIRHCRALDMPLAGIKRLLNFVAHPDAGILASPSISNTGPSTPPARIAPASQGASPRARRTRGARRTWR